MNENEEKVIDVNVIDDKKSKMNPKEKRNAIIICSVGAAILLGTIIIPVIGHFSSQISPSKKSSPSFSWDNQTPGLYTENGLFRTNSNVFSLEKEGERYIVYGVNSTDEDKYLIMPSAVNVSSENKTYAINSVALKNEGDSNIFNSTDSKIKGVYFSGLYSKIGSFSFQNLLNLEEVKFGSGEGSQSIEKNAFANDISLKNIVFSKNLVSVGESAFENNTALVSINFKDTKLQTLSKNAFAGCTSLSEVTLPSSLSSVSESLFLGCTSLETIKYSNTVAAFTNLTRGVDWSKGSSIKEVVCTDSTITL